MRKPWESGSVAYMFEKLGYFEVKVSNENKEQTMLEIWN